LCIDLCKIRRPAFQGKNFLALLHINAKTGRRPPAPSGQGGNGSNLKGAKGVITLLGWWVVRLRGAMHLDTEKAVTALMTVAIAGVGPACIGLMLLL
jgi:hypothetical protein